jgi:molybdopterin molybdotransferase
LPGNPVSALIIAKHFLLPVINLVSGLREDYLQPFIHAKLNLNLASQAGREDWIPVRVEVNKSEYIAEPVFGKSNLIFTLARSNGLICIPADTTGLSAGEIVKVYLF